MAWKIPFGRAQGTPITEADESDLKWIRKTIAEKLEEDPNKQYADRDRQFLGAVDAELRSRSGGGSGAPARQPRPRTQALAKAPPQTVALGKAMHDPVALNKTIRKLSEEYHLVSPATHVDALPPGCGVATSFVAINKDPDAGEVYKLAGQVGLSGVTLAKIAAAFGVDWDPHLSGRLDDGSDPHYCHFRAVCRVRSFDGSIRTVSGEVEIDAREGSPQIDEIRKKAEKRNKPNDGGESQILELRKFLLRHAESKAQNRAIAKAAGIKRSYKPDELDKPFAVMRLMWTGESDDPETKRIFAEKTADAMIGGSRALYGQPQQARQLTTGHAPPPVGSVEPPPDSDGDDDYPPENTYDAAGEEGPPSDPGPDNYDGYDRGDSADDY